MQLQHNTKNITMSVKYVALMAELETHSYKAKKV